MTNKVVVKFKDKSIMKGQTNNFLPNKPFFHLHKVTGEKVEVHLKDLKAIFFVKDYGGNKTQKKEYKVKFQAGVEKYRLNYWTER